MNWRMKALLQQVLSRVPQGERLNHFLQRHVTRSLPTGDASCAVIVAQAREHVRTIARHYRRALGDSLFYEFGAGCDLMIPLAYYGLGVGRQILVDLRPLLRPELVNATIAQFARLSPDLELPRVPAQPLPSGGTAALTLLRERYGMEYRAPADARDTGLPAAGVDCITCTNTLEHIPRDDIARILTECRQPFSRAPGLTCWTPSSFARPLRALISARGSIASGWRWGSNFVWGAPRHNGTVVVLFTDGHVKSGRSL